MGKQMLGHPGRPVLPPRSSTAGWSSERARPALGSVIIVLPTALVFVLLQKQFVGGLTLGANKG